MRYPLGSSNQDFLNRFYNAQPFGTPTSYGFHEGEDYNSKTGGDSDLGEPLYAVADGKIVYYHNNSHSTTGFGRHMVLQCETPRGTRWYGYNHCQELTAQVKEVKEGEVIGKLGKSGTTVAHLHFSVFKVDPSNLYKGIDSIAKTKADLNAYWEKFELLSMPEKTYTQAEWQAERDERNKNWDLFQAEKADHEATKGELSEVRTSHNQFLQNLATKLVCLADEANILGTIDRLLEVEDQLTKSRKDYSQLEKEKFMLESDKNREIERLQDELSDMRKENISFQSKLATQFMEIEKLSNRIEELLGLPQEKPILPHLNGLSGLIKSIKSVIRRLLLWN